MNTFDLSAEDDPRPDVGADFDQAAGAEGAAGWPEPEGLPADVAEAPEVAEATVRQWLDLLGVGLNYTLPGRNYGVDDAWRMDQENLDAMAPPATALLNRRPALRAIAARTDVEAVTLLFALGRYVVTNAAEVVQARKDAEGERPHLGGQGGAEGPEPGAGAAWPGLTGVPTS